jgi:hypothetical protein
VVDDGLDQCGMKHESIRSDLFGGLMGANFLEDLICWKIYIDL